MFLVFTLHYTDALRLMHCITSKSEKFLTSCLVLVCTVWQAIDSHGRVRNVAILSENPSAGCTVQVSLAPNLLPLLPPEGCEELVLLDHVSVDPLIEEPITRLVLDTKAAIPLQADFRIHTSSVAHYTYGSGGMFL